MRRRVALLLFQTALLHATVARAWIYSEHRAITARGIETLDAAQRRALDALWDVAREGHVTRLCGAADAGQPHGRPDCIDLAAWPSIAADHACSSEEMLALVLASGWILNVADIGGTTGEVIARARNESDRRNAQMNGDLRLERVDPEYSARARANSAHHMLPRS